MSLTQSGPIEIGVFDFSRLPIFWNNIDPEKIEQAVTTIESHVDEQVQQLQSRVDQQKDVQNNIEEKK
jgi:hypothetical protein